MKCIFIIMKYKCNIDQPSRVVKIKLALIKSQLSVSRKHNNNHVYDFIYERVKKLW